MVYAKVTNDADILGRHIGFETIVGHIRDVVVVKVDRHRFRLSLLRWACCLIGCYCIMEVRNMVVAHNMALPSHRDPIVRAVGAGGFLMDRRLGGKLCFKGNKSF